MDKFSDNKMMRRIIIDIRARSMACKILEVTEGVSKKELRKAYRRASLKYHPDHNQDDPTANKKFVLIKCAYGFLAEDEPCPELLEDINSWPGVPENDKYRLDNSWGHFLWWREKYFDSEKEKNSNGKRSSCI